MDEQACLNRARNADSFAFTNAEAVRRTVTEIRSSSAAANAFLDTS
jgi:hypothetical protein